MIAVGRGIPRPKVDRAVGGSRAATLFTKFSVDASWPPISSSLMGEVAVQRRYAAACRLSRAILFGGRVKYCCARQKSNTPENAAVWGISFMRLGEIQSRSRTEARALSIPLSAARRSTSIPFRSLPLTSIAVRANLSAWGVLPRMRVGIYAPNSYYWLVYDLALIEIGAIAVPFTDDFVGAVNSGIAGPLQYRARYCWGPSHARLFTPRPRHVAFIDCENGDVAVFPRRLSGDPDEEDQHSLVFSPGSAGGLKGLVISRKGVEITLPPIITAIGMSTKDRMQLFLPMSNFQQRNMCYSAIWYDRLRYHHHGLYKSFSPR